MTWTLDSIHDLTLTWLRAHDWLGGKCTAVQLNKWRFHEFAALWFPTAKREIVLHASMWSQLIAVLDDMCEEDATSIAHLRALVRGGHSSNDLLLSLAAAWRDLRAQIANDDADCAAYLDQALDDMFNAYEWEHTWRSRGDYPPYAEYDHWRWLSGGLKIYAAVLAKHCDMPIARLRDPALERLVRAAGTLACMANDGASAEWDRSQGNPINAVCIAEAHKTKSFAQWKAKWRAPLQANPPSRDPFRAGLEHFVAGTTQWMQLTGRYIPEHLTLEL